MRYALYFTPPKDDPLTVAACEWLGRDAFSGRETDLRDRGDVSAAELFRLTSDPRRYGFHATLKAPFSLADGADEEALLSAFETFAAETEAFQLPAVIIGQLGPFFALVPSTPVLRLQNFAAEVVEYFEPFRAPLSQADMARRNPDRLSDSQRDNLVRWGYPHVMEDFRFHMTLTGPVEAEYEPAMRKALSAHFDSFIGKPLKIGGLALFAEKTRGDPFFIHSWLPMSASQALKEA